MKKIILSVAAGLFAVSAFAQLNIGFGYHGELHDFKDTKDSKTEHYDMHGAYVGASYNFCLTGDDGFGIAPGAYFSFAGDIEDKIFTRHTSVDIPVHLTYSFDAGPGLFFAYAGPAFSVGINFKQKWIGDNPGTDDVLIDWYKKDVGVLSRFDLKVGLGIGYSWEHLMFNAGWEFGALNRYTKDFVQLTPGGSYHLHSFHAGLAYVF